MSDLPPLPCVGCGWCCLHDQCEVSHHIHGYMSRCPEVFWDPGRVRYLCRLALDPAKGDAYRALLLVGQGCCARFNDWRDNVRDRDNDG